MGTDYYEANQRLIGPGDSIRTYYSLTDQVDWDAALRFGNGVVNPLGLYDLDRKIRPAGETYRELIREWRKILPTQSHSLSLNY